MIELPAGELRTIHVRRAILVEGERDVFVIRQEGARNLLATEVEIVGPSKLVYRPDNPVGNRVMVETQAGVRYE